jgi:hypothetical protein
VIVVDTSVTVAYMNATDDSHHLVASWLSTSQRSMIGTSVRFDP